MTMAPHAAAASARRQQAREKISSLVDKSVSFADSSSSRCRRYPSPRPPVRVGDSDSLQPGMMGMSRRMTAGKSAEGQRHQQDEAGVGAGAPAAPFAALRRRRLAALAALAVSAVCLYDSLSTPSASLSALRGIWDEDARLRNQQRAKLERLRRSATTTEFTGEPSHLRMCRELLPRFEHALAVDTARKKADALGLSGMNLANIPELQMPDPVDFEYLIVEEDEAVCRDAASPHLALLQIASSTLLSAASRKFELNVEYRHNCPRWRDGSSPADDPVRVQEMLPPDLLDSSPHYQSSGVPMEVLAIKNICQGCITETEQSGVSKRNCALFTRPTVYNIFTLNEGKKKKRGWKTMAAKRAQEEEEKRAREEAQRAKAVQLGIAGVATPEEAQLAGGNGGAAEALVTAAAATVSEVETPEETAQPPTRGEEAQGEEAQDQDEEAQDQDAQDQDAQEQEAQDQGAQGTEDADDHVGDTAVARRLQEAIEDVARRLQEDAVPEAKTEVAPASEAEAAAAAATAQPPAAPAAPASPDPTKAAPLGAASAASTNRAAAQKSQQLPTGIVAVLPVLVDALRHISSVWQEARLAATGEAIDGRITTRPGAMVGPTQKSPEEQEIMERRKGEKTSYSAATNDEAVVYLSCKKEDCADEEVGEALAMPYYVYATEIPRHVASISVVASADCTANIEGCRDHGQALAKFFREFYPRAQVEFLDEVSTYAAYARMVNAQYLVCPPGVGCVLPAMAQLGRSTLVGNPHLVPWLNLLPAEAVWNATFLHFQEVPVSPVAEMDYDVFLKKIPPGKIGQCRQLRGRLGQWVQDMDAAAQGQYVTPIRHYAGEADLRFQPTPENPFRPATTYRWAETTFPTCDAQRLTKEGLCDAMLEAEMERIFILGDSMGMNMAQSLWKLTGHEDNPSEFGTRDPNWDRIIECGPDYDDFAFTLSFGRNDQLLENDRPVDVDAGIRNCFAYCYPWTERYASYPGKTLLIVNTGPHYQSHHEYQYTMRQVVKTVDAMNRPEDVLLWRTSVPGHRDCDAPGLTPFESYAEYAPTVTDEYSWDKFVGYNDYASQLLDMRARDERRGPPEISPKPPPKMGLDGVPLPPPPPPPPTRTRMELLDVYPMSVLRRDGHVSSADECPSCSAGGQERDCLHWFLPGPPDWWGHAMYSHLLDLSRRGT